MKELATGLFILSLLCWLTEQRQPPTAGQAAAMVLGMIGCGLTIRECLKER